MRSSVSRRSVGRGSALMAAALALASVAWAVPVAQADQAATQPEYLFSLNTDRGTSTRVGKDSGEQRFVLTMHGVSERATQFADRPFRNAYLLSTRTLIKKWGTWFGDSPPNAVLTYTDPKRSKDPAPSTIVVKLLKPRYSPKTDTLRFTAQHLHRSVSPVNGDKVRLPNRRPPARFTRGSLFIDTVATSDKCTFITYASCPNVDFSDDYLTGDASYSDFTGADFSRSFLDAQMVRTTLDNAKLVDAKGVTSQNWTRVSLVGADMTRAQFQGTSFFGATLDNAILTDANLQRADFRGATLFGANLGGADLRGANLTEAVFTRARILGVLTDSTTKCPNGSAGPCTTLDQWRPLGPTP